MNNGAPVPVLQETFPLTKISFFLREIVTQIDNYVIVYMARQQFWQSMCNVCGVQTCRENPFWSDVNCEQSDIKIAISMAV